MIGSIVLVILGLLGKINADESMRFFILYFLGLAVEIIIYILSISKILDKFDEWRKKNEKRSRRES